MRRTENPAISQAAVLIVVCLALLTAGYSISGSLLRSDSTHNHALSVNTNAGLQNAESQDVPAEERQADAIQKMKGYLLELPAEQGGGYFLNQDILELRDDEWSDMVRVPGIRAIEGISFSATAWGCFDQLKDLESLNLRHGNVSDDALRSLAQLSKLEVLTLHTPVSNSQPEAYYGREPPYSAVALEPLRTMDQLRQLALSSDRLLDDALSQVAAVPHLLSLSLHGHFTNEGLKHLSHLPEIRRLSLSGRYDDAGLIHLAELETLETLTLSSDRLTGRGLAHLAKLPNLRHLTIRGLRPGWTFSALDEFVALEVLKVGDDRLTDEILATLPCSDRISSLSLRGAFNVTDDAMKYLLRFSQLEELDLLLTGITHEGLETVSACQNLRTLLLGLRGDGTAQDIERGLANLSRLPRLEALDLRYVDLRGVDLRVLKIPTLKKLNVAYHRVQEEIEQLRAQIPRLDPVTTERITIRAGMDGVSSYDYLTNELEVEIE